MMSELSEISAKRPSDLASYADLFLRMVDSTLLVDSITLNIIDANDAAERLLGLTLNEMLGTSVLRWSEAEDKRAFEKDLRIARRRYYARESETRLKVGDGRIAIVRVVACVLKLEDGSEPLQMVIRDITREREDAEKIKGYVQELEVLNKKLEELSIVDDLTKLYNKRHFKAQLEREDRRAHRYTGRFSLLFFDVDHFKHYNDRNGHPAGDEILRRVGALLKGNCRASDLCARYGGEEFVILCPETTWENACVLAEKLRAKIEQEELPFREHQPLGKVTVSIGVASFPENGSGANEILEAADKALYRSKAEGRNRVTAFSEIPVHLKKTA